MENIEIKNIVIDKEIYPRQQTSTKTVDEYAEALQTGDVFPAIVLEKDTNLLLDGMHRLQAHKKAKRTEINAVWHVIPDDIPNTIPEKDRKRLYSLSLSTKHGDRIPMDDRKRLAWDIYGKDETYDLTTLAKYLGVGRSTVTRWIKPLREERARKEQENREKRKIQVFLLTKAGWKQREIVERLGVPKSTVSDDAQVGATGQYSQDQLWWAGRELEDDIKLGEVIANIHPPYTPPKSDKDDKDAKKKAKKELNPPSDDIMAELSRRKLVSEILPLLAKSNSLLHDAQAKFGEATFEFDDEAKKAFRKYIEQILETAINLNNRVSNLDTELQNLVNGNDNQS